MPVGDGGDIAAELRRTVEQLTTILRTIADGIIVTDAVGKMIYANEAARRVLPYDSVDALLRQTPADVFARFEIRDEHGQSITPMDLPGVQVIAGARTASKVVRFIDRRDGTEHVSIVNSARVDDEADELRYIVNSFTDITAQVRTEEHLRQAQKLEAVGALAGGVAHDFNNLLAVMLGNASLLTVAGPLNAEQAELVQEIQQAAERARGVTSQLLAFSRKQIVQKHVLDLNALLIDTSRLLARVIGEHIRLETCASMEQCLVEEDPDQLVQVMMNLAINARDAMPSGGELRIETGRCAHIDRPRGTAPEHFAMLTIADTGTGIEERIRARMFEPFFTTKPAGQGTGLGLSTVHGIVHQSGGHLRVTSSVGAGTTFEVCFPRVNAEVATVGAPTRADVRTSRATILVVEDEPSLARIVRRVLERAGYVVLEAHDLTSAMAVVATHDGRVDLLVTDVVLPNGSGVVVAQELGRRYRDLLVLFMSGYVADSGFELANLPPSAAFLPKPFSPDMLRAAVAALLAHRQLTT